MLPSPNLSAYLNLYQPIWTQILSFWLFLIRQTPFMLFSGQPHHIHWSSSYLMESRTTHPQFLVSTEPTF